MEHKLFSLHNACNEVQLDKIKYLLAKGADINKLDHFKQTPLHCLISSSASIWSFCSGLNLSLDKDNKLKVAQYLLEKGANPNMISHNGTGSTPLHVATNIGDIKMIELLIRYGAKPWFRNGEGKTVLHIAVQRGCRDIIQKFLDIGIRANSVDYKGRTPLHDVKSPEVIPLLIRCGANPNWLDYKYHTPIHCYLKSKNYLCCRDILESGADVNMKCENGLTALHYAVKTGDIKLVQLVLGYKADIDSKTKRGDTPLHLAVNNGQNKIVKLLLKNDANLNVQNNVCDTPLHLAAQRAQPNHEIISNLLNYEPDLRIVNEEGQTPLDYVGLPHYEPQIRQLLLYHALKLKAADLMTFDENTDYYLNQYEVNYYRQCLSEVELLKANDLLKVLTMPTHALTYTLKNYKVDQKTFYYSKGFPIYCKLLERRFLIAMDRKKLLSLMEDCLDTLFASSDYNLPRLPPECYRFIHRYFNNREMKIFIKSMM